MNHGIQPAYHICTVTCGCGNTFVTRSTKPKISVEICAKCHPFFTGKQKFVDTAGMVEKFQKKYAAAAYTAAKPVRAKKSAATPKAVQSGSALALAPGNPKAPPPAPGQKSGSLLGRGPGRGFGGPRGGGGREGGGRGAPPAGKTAAAAKPAPAPAKPAEAKPASAPAPAPAADSKAATPS